MDFCVSLHHLYMMINFKQLLISLILFTGSTTFALAADTATCVNSKAEAQRDLKQGKAQLMLQGGFAPVHIAGQELFERKYHLSYFDLGCVVSSNLCIAHYNAEVAKFLDKKYGKAWRKEVRKDVTGLRSTSAH
jgi:hypothetical protein